MQTAIVPISVEVSANVGRIGDSHALIESLVYTSPVGPNQERSLLKRTWHLVVAKDVDQVVQSIFDDPMALVVDRECVDRKYGYIVPLEYNAEFHPIQHARIVDNVAVDHEGNPLLPEFVTPDGLFNALPLSLVNTVPLPQKVLLEESFYFENDFQLTNEWLDLDSAVDALNTIPGILAVDFDAHPSDVTPEVQRTMRIVVDSAIHRPVIEAAVRQYHAYAADESVLFFESQDLYSLTFNTIVKPVIAPFIIKTSD